MGLPGAKKTPSGQWATPATLLEELAQAGHDVTVYNRTPAKSAAWTAEFADGGATFLGMAKEDLFRIAEMLVLALVAILVILLVVGAVASNFAGRKLVQWGDALVHRIPVVRSIYSSVKQVSDTLFS